MDQSSMVPALQECCDEACQTATATGLWGNLPQNDGMFVSGSTANLGIIFPGGGSIILTYGYSRSIGDVVIPADSLAFFHSSQPSVAGISRYGGSEIELLPWPQNGDVWELSVSWCPECVNGITGRVTIDGILYQSLTISDWCAVDPSLPSTPSHFGLGVQDGLLPVTVTSFALECGALPDGTLVGWSECVPDSFLDNFVGPAGPLGPRWEEWDNGYPTEPLELSGDGSVRGDLEGDLRSWVFVGGPSSPPECGGLSASTGETGWVGNPFIHSMVSGSDNTMVVGGSLWVPGWSVATPDAGVWDIDITVNVEVSITGAVSDPKMLVTADSLSHNTVSFTDVQTYGTPVSNGVYQLHFNGQVTTVAGSDEIRLWLFAGASSPIPWGAGYMEFCSLSATVVITETGA